MKVNTADETIIAFAELPEPPYGLSPRQMADAESLPIEKRRIERRAVYTLINRHIFPNLLITHNSDGAPLLLQPDSTPFPGHFSLSHCRTAAAIAYNPTRHIGIDIEDISQRLRHIADKFLSDDEKRLLSPLTDKQLLAAWTFKEAAFKCLSDSQLVLSGIIIESLHAAETHIEMHASAPSAKAYGHITFTPDNKRALAIATKIK